MFNLKVISIFKITVFSSCEDLAGEEGKEWTLKYLKCQGLSEIWKVYIFGNSLILKDASKDFEWLIEDDTFTHAKFASKPKKKKMRSERSVFLGKKNPSKAILKRNLSQ